MFPSRRATLGGDVFRDEFSVSFDGTDEFIDTTFVPNYDVFTISAWINVNTGGNRIIFDGRDNVNDGMLFFIGSDEKISLRVNSVQVNAPSTIIPNVWHHVVGTSDGSTGKLYLNGVEIKKREALGTTISNITSDAMIGARNPSTPVSYFNGEISEIAFYNKSLSASEVKTIYNGREPYNHKEGVCYNNLVAWYRMGDGALDRFGITGSTSYQNGVITDVVNAKLGNNLVTNGDFSSWTSDTPDSWTLYSVSTDNTYHRVGNAIRFNNTTGQLQEISQNILTANKIYRVTIDCIAFDSGTGFRVQSGDDGTNRPINILSSSGLGTFVGYFKAEDHRFRIIRNSAVDATFTNVTCREVLGNTGIVRNMTPTNIIGNTP